MFESREIKEFITPSEASVLARVFEEQDNKLFKNEYSKLTGLTTELPGNPFYELFLDLITKEVEEIVGESVVPTYAFARKYYDGTYLKRHVDRASCVYTASLTIEQEHNIKWPLWFEKNNVVYGSEGNVGNLVILKGCEIPHWREELTGGSQTQLFLHFVPDTDAYKDYFYDGRSALSLDLIGAKLIDSKEEREVIEFSELKKNYFEAVEEALNIMNQDLIGECLER